jgi:hypothetical protein
MDRVGTQDRRGGMGLHGGTGFWHCFRCGAAGRLPEYDGQGEGRNREIEEPDEPVVMERAEHWYPLTGPDGEAHVLRPAWEFLTGRGVGPELVEAAYIGACARGELRERVVIPVLDADETRGQDAWLGWVARAWQRKGHPMPYRYPKGMQRQGLLWNVRALIDPSDEPLIVGEGVFDVIHYWPDGVALFGKPDELQLGALADTARPVAVCLDGDAWEQAWMMALKLQMMGQHAGAVRLPPGTDPDEVPREALREAAAACIDRLDPVRLDV